MKLPGVWCPKKGSQVQESKQPGVAAALAQAAPFQRRAAWAALLTRNPLHRLSPRTMLNVLLLCCGLLQGIQAILSADLSRSHLQKENGRLEGIDRAHYSSLLQKVKEMSAEPAGESCGPLSSCCLPTSRLLMWPPKQKRGPHTWGQTQGIPSK